MLTTSVSASVRTTSAITTTETTARLSCISRSSTATTSASTSPTPARGPEARRLTRDVLEEARYFLVCFTKQLQQILHNTTIATIEERCRQASVSGTTCAANTMDVVIDVRRQVVVDDVRDVWNIEAASSHGSGDHDRASTIAEELESTLTLALSSVTVL
jgi:hypothetical protein